MIPAYPGLKLGSCLAERVLAVQVNATALLDIEPRLRKVMGYRHLPRLREALKRELNIDTTTKTKAA